MLKNYYRLTKPGIVYGNLLTTIAAYAYASRWHIDTATFAAAIFGLGFVIASACVFNNYLDRDIDEKMARTKDRALVTGAISKRNALIFASVLGAAGFAILFIFVNALTALVALAGFVVYVAIYSPLKRSTHWATEIGSIAGSVPIVVGYTAATQSLDVTALNLFLILALWQMPHFYAIAVYRAKEYASAGIPVLPLQKGIKTAKIRMIFYIVLFILAAMALTISGRAGHIYATVMLLIGLAWLWRAIRGFYALDDEWWARKLFFFSLIVLLVFCAALSVATIVP